MAEQEEDREKVSAPEGFITNGEGTSDIKKEIDRRRVVVYVESYSHLSVRVVGVQPCFHLHLYPVSTSHSPWRLYNRSLLHCTLGMKS